MIAFLYPFLTLVQPGILFPALDVLRPMQLVSAIALLSVLATRRLSGPQVQARLADPTMFWVFAFVLLQVVSRFRYGMGSMTEVFSFWFTFAIFVATSVLLIVDERDFRNYLWGMILGGAVVIGYGLIAVAQHSPKLAGGRAGAYGMYENHNDYSFAILTVFPFAWQLLRVTGGFVKRLVLYLVLLACVVGTLLSLSRGGMLCLVMAGGMLIWQSTGGVRRILIVSLFGVLAAGAVVYQFAAREENQRGHYSAEDAKSSRYELWRAARKIIIDHPILGVGSGRFSEFAGDYEDLSHDQKGKVTHNTFLEVATGSGLTGLGAFLMMLIGAIRVSSPKLSRQSRVPEPLVTATFICVLVMMARGMLDAKPHDWSYYFIAVMAVALANLRLAPGDAGADEEKPAVAERRPAGRPSVYGRAI